MSAIFIFEAKAAKKKQQNFHFLKGCFSVMHGPIDMIFGVIFGDLCET